MVELHSRLLSSLSDARFKLLVDKTAQSGFKIAEVNADKAYLGGTNLHITLRHGAIPYIPFKSNSVAQSGTSPKFDAEQCSQSHFDLYQQISFRCGQSWRLCVKQIVELRIFTAFSHRPQYN